MANNLKWDLTPLCKDEQEFYAFCEKLRGKLHNFDKYKGHLSDEKAVISCFNEMHEFELEVSKPVLYAELKNAEDTTNDSNSRMVETISMLLTEFNTLVSFIDSDIKALPDSFFDKLIADKKYANFKRTFQSIKKDKAHMLSKQEEQLLSGMDFLGGFSENMHKFTDGDMTFADIKDCKGKIHKLNESNISLYSVSADRTLRKNAFETILGTYGKYTNFLSTNYINDVKSSCYFAKVRHFKSVLDGKLENEEVTKCVYDNLISSVHKNLPLLYRFYSLKQRILGLKDFYNYDVHAALKKGSQKKYTFDEAIEIIKKAVSPLGEQYVALIERAKRERWIDVLPSRGKQKGAFSTAIEGVHPYVLTNFEGDLESVFTLAHELGHAMHSHYSFKNQPWQTGEYVIFVAEVASTTNEMLLLNYLLNNAKTKQEKLDLYDKLFESVKSTIFRQTMFAEFEEKVHAAYESGQPLSKDLLNNLYFELNKLYYGKKVKLQKELMFEWARIPHFFTSFYVYKYATGLITALSFTRRFMAGDKDILKDYMGFLSAGSSKTPIEILKDAGCDLENEKTFDDVFDYLKQKLTEYENLAR